MKWLKYSAQRVIFMVCRSNGANKLLLTASPHSFSNNIFKTVILLWGSFVIIRTVGKCGKQTCLKEIGDNSNNVMYCVVSSTSNKHYNTPVWKLFQSPYNFYTADNRECNKMTPRATSELFYYHFLFQQLFFF